jgi:hypothetical protein
VRSKRYAMLEYSNFGYQEYLASRHSMTFFRVHNNNKRTGRDARRAAHAEEDTANLALRATHQHYRTR